MATKYKQTANSEYGVKETQEGRGKGVWLVAPPKKWLHCTMVLNNQASRRKSWATHSFTHTAHSFACSALLASLLRSAAANRLLTHSFTHSLTSSWESESLDAETFGTIVPKKWLHWGNKCVPQASLKTLNEKRDGEKYLRNEIEKEERKRTRPIAISRVRTQQQQ